jgi:hypothetical protein
MVLERIFKADEALRASSAGDAGKSKGATVNRNRWTKS